MHPLTLRAGLLLAALLMLAGSADAHGLDELIDCVRDGQFC